MNKLLLISILSILVLNKVTSQDLAFFDLPLYSDKVTLCEAIEKYEINDRIDFKFIKIGKRLHSLVLNYDDTIFAKKSFVLIRDTITANQFSLNQIGLSSKEFQVNQKNFDTLLNKTKIILNQFEERFGKPTKTVNRQERYFGQSNTEIAGDIISATWDTNKVKLKITFSMEGEHERFLYLLRINKFKDYLGNKKLPEWWNGY